MRGSLDVSLMYELVYNPAASFLDDGVPAYEGMCEVTLRGPVADVVDKVDWSSETDMERTSMRLQVVYMYGRVKSTLIDVLGDGGFEDAHAVTNYGSSDWEEGCLEALDGLASGLCSRMKVRGRESAFLRGWALLPDKTERPVERIREYFRLIISFGRIAQVDKINELMTYNSPIVNVTNGEPILEWFRVRVKNRESSDTYTRDWVEGAVAVMGERERASEERGEAARIMGQAIAKVVCRYQVYESSLPESLELDRARLSRAYKEMERLAELLALYDVVRGYACRVFGTEDAVGALVDLDAVPLVETSVEEYKRAARDIIGSYCMWEGSGSSARFIGVDDFERCIHEEMGVITRRNMLASVLIRSSRNYGIVTRDWMDSDADIVSPLFLEEIQKWCRSVNSVIRANVRVFLPYYMDIMVSQNVVRDDVVRRMEVRGSWKEWIGKRAGKVVQWIRVF